VTLNGAARGRRSVERRATATPKPVQADGATGAVDSKLSCPVYRAHDLSGFFFRLFQPDAEISSLTVGRDQLYGGRGHDVLIRDAKDRVSNGGDGHDRVVMLGKDALAMRTQTKLLSGQPSWLRQFVG
jgi:hypothetical protein